MKTSKRPTWTTRDKETLERLKKKQEAFVDEYRPEVMAFAREMLTVHEDWSKSPEVDPDEPMSQCFDDFMADWLIRNADRIRDALQPFDSGARMAEHVEAPAG